MSGQINLRWKRPPLPFPPPDLQLEQYGTGTSPAGDTTLNWITFIHNDVPRPMGIVVHVGVFRAGQPGPLSVARSLYDAGYNALCVQHRLADPGNDMRGTSGDQPVDDHGQHPEQVEDISAAILAAKNGSTPLTDGWSTGEVFGVGGSSGGAHIAWFAAAEHNPGDKLQCGVMLSGAYDFHDPTSLAGTCVPNEFGNGVRNYIGCTKGDPACEGDGGALDLASPIRRFTSESSPVRFYSTQIDSMPLPQYNLLKDRLTLILAPFESRLLTEAVYNTVTGCTRHAFAYWFPKNPTWTDSVYVESIEFLEAHIPHP